MFLGVLTTDGAEEDFFDTFEFQLGQVGNALSMAFR